MLKINLFYYNYGGGILKTQKRTADEQYKCKCIVRWILKRYVYMSDMPGP